MKTCVHTKTWWVFTAASSTTAPNWKQPKCLSTGKQTDKLWYVHTMEYYSGIKRNKRLIHATTWMNPHNGMLSERRHKTIYRTIPLIWNVQKRPIYRKRKEVTGCPWLQEGRRKQGVTANGCQASFGDDGNVLKLDSGDDCTTWQMY